MCIILLTRHMVKWLLFVYINSSLVQFHVVVSFGNISWNVLQKLVQQNWDDVFLSNDWYRRNKGLVSVLSNDFLTRRTLTQD